MNTQPEIRRRGIGAAIEELLTRNLRPESGRATVNEKTITNKILRRAYGKSGTTTHINNRVALKAKNRMKYKAVVKRSKTA